jgi:glycosyltransferase involved in cell wall biosynthesis
MESALEDANARRSAWLSGRTTRERIELVVSKWLSPATNVLIEGHVTTVPLDQSGSIDPGGEILLAGHFDPAMIASLLSIEGAAQLAGLNGEPGVPIHHLASGLANRGIRTTVLGGLRGTSDIYVRDTPISAVIYNTRSSRAFTLTGFLRERTAILERLRQIRPAIVHAHWTLEAARAVGDWTGPKILTVHDAAYEYARIGWNWHPGAIAYKARWIANTLAVLKKFDHVIAVSPFVESYLRLRHRFRGEIRVIPNSIPPFPAEIRPVETFPRSGLLTFGCYGMPGRLKNVENAIDAFLMLHKDLPDSRLLIFGKGWTDLGERYRHRSIELRELVRHDSFIRTLASEIDIWVHPSRMETHGIAICEAIQAGCPVIAGRASGAVPWTLDYGKAGVLVDIEKPEKIAEAMLLLARDPSRAMALVSYGRRMILDRFSPERVLDMHLQYYRDVISHGKYKAS